MNPTLPVGRPRMIAIDMDGTLVHPDGKVSQRNQAALLRARKAGVRIVIATGRRHGYAMKILRDISLDRDDVVLSSNGTVARTVSGKLLFRRHMPLDTARRMCAGVGEFRNCLVLTFDVIGPDGEDAEGALVLESLDALHRSIGKWMDSNAPFIRRVQPIEDALTGSDEASLPIQAMLCGTVARMQLAEALLSRTLTDELELFRTEYPLRDLCILDMLPKGCSKGSGLSLLLEANGFSADDLMGIGDNWNDLPMLELARWPVLMGNAPPALQALAAERGWRVGTRHEQDAVADAISAFFR